MNRDKILKMEAGREMDELIAIGIMGLPRRSELENDSPCPDCGTPLYKRASRAARAKCDSCNDWKYSPYKEYSTDISAAWEVFEELVKKWDIVEVWYERNTDPKWWCEFISGGDGNNAFADTAPLAICRVALLTNKKAE